MVSWKQTAKQTILGVLILLSMPAIAAASQSSSSNYQVNEVFFGSGGELNACSTSYCSKQSAGDTTVGRTASTGYQAQGGFNTDRSAYIQFTVGDSNIDLGTLTTNTTKTANATFSVKAYLSHGYSVVNASDPPSNNNYKMKAITIPTNSQPGTEQYGINLAANTNPVTFGASPVLNPDSSFSFGQVSTDYVTPNFYKYAINDVIALSNASTSDTIYTISYIFNIGNVTPGGVYELHHVLVATATF